MAQQRGIIAIIGWLTVCYILIKVTYILRIYLLPSRITRFAHVTPNGDSPWALVTGASDGIGTEFARELAHQGFNVVLHGRNDAKLSLVKEKLQKSYPGRSFKVLVADASRVECVNCIKSNQRTQKEAIGQGAPDFKSIKAALDGLHLTVLINNAGGGPSNPTFQLLQDFSEERVANNVSLNALFPLHLMRELLPMLSQNGPSLIMNISSMSDAGFPLLSSYGASKQFLMNLTRTVGLEMTLDDAVGRVEVLGVRVGRVTGVSHCDMKPSMFMPSSQTLARAALSRAGYGHGAVIGYWAHALQGVFVDVLPTWVEHRFIQAVMKKERDMELANKSD